MRESDAFRQTTERTNVRRIRSHLTYANVMSTLAALFALSGGVAYAANTIASSDIIDGEVKTADLAANAVSSPKIADGQVTEADIGQGAVNTAELKNDAVTAQKVLNETLVGNDVAANTLKGADIDEATLDIGDAARAYASVDPDLCSAQGICQAQQAKGVTTVTRDATGQYCVTAPGIDSASTPAAVTVDWSATTNPEGNASAMTREVACATTSGFEVYTERQPNVAVDQGGMVGAATVAGQAVLADDVGFTIVIP